MRIIVNNGEKLNLSLPIPNCLMFNSLSAWIISHHLDNMDDETEENDINLSPEQLKKLFAVLKKSSKQMRADGLSLVEATTSEGEYLRIEL